MAEEAIYDTVIFGHRSFGDLSPWWASRQDEKTTNRFSTMSPSVLIFETKEDISDVMSLAILQTEDSFASTLETAIENEQTTSTAEYNVLEMSDMTAAEVRELYGKIDAMRAELGGKIDKIDSNITELKVNYGRIDERLKTIETKGIKIANAWVAIGTVVASVAALGALAVAIFK